MAKSNIYGEPMHTHGRDKKKKKNPVLIFGIILGCIAVALGVLFLGSLILGNNNTSRDNIIKLAERYRDKGEFSRALDLLDSLLLKNPDDDAAKKLQDEILAEKKEKETALSESDKQREEQARRERENLDKELINSLKDRNHQKISNSNNQENPAATNPPEVKGDKVRELIEKGKREYDNEQYDNAIKTFNDVLKEPKADDKAKAVAYAYIGDSYFEENPDDSGNRQKAKDNAEKSENLDPSLSTPHVTLGKVYETEKKLEMAEHEYKQATLLDSKDWFTYYSLGIIQFRLSKYNDARISFETCIKLKPDFEKAFYNLGMTQKRLNDTDKALKAYQSAISDKPDFYQAYNELGLLLRDRNDLDGAINAFKSAVRYAPQTEKSSALYYRNLAVALIAKGNFLDAEKNLTTALALNPDDAESSYKMANVKYNLGKPNEGLDYAKKAVSSKPNVKDYNYQLGLIYEAISDSDNAIKYYSKAIEIDPNYVSPLINLGNIYMIGALFDKALPLYLSAYKIDPDNYKVNNNLGNIYKAKEQYPDAIKYLEKAVLLNPKEAEPRYNLGDAYNKTSRFEDAKNAFNDIIKLNPSYWDAYYQYALLLVKEGDKANAKIILNTLLAKNPNYDKKNEVKDILGGL
jgi:tetratricopeptide (TPR) repeat protein